MKIIDSADVVVIGAGIIGASCAYHLADRGLRVVVVDGLAAPAAGSTGRSFASVRAQWPDPLNIELSWRSIQMYRAFENDHAVSIAYRASGYLFLVPEALWDAQLAAVRLQREHGVPVEVLTLDEARGRTPFEPRGLAGATWGPADGVVDPVLVTQAYLCRARTKGTSVRLSHTVSGMQELSDGWRVDTHRGSIATDFVVNAAGGWSGGIAALAGLSVPVQHSRRCVYATGPLPGFPRVPMTVDMATGGYLRSEHDRVLFALANVAECPGLNVTVDWDWMQTVLDRMTPRFPWLGDAPLDSRAAWAGTYELTPDHRPVLGRSAQADRWVNACGFSGHGVMQAPAIGMLIAEEIIDGRAGTVDIDPLRDDRFAHGAAVPAGMVY